MKIFTKKSVIQKIIFAVLIIILCSMIIPNYVHADITKEPKSGGTLFNPVKSLLTAIGDVFLNLVQSTIFTEGSKMSAAAEGLTFDVKPDNDARDEGNWWDDSNDNNVAYPGYLYLTPEAIFSNKISLLNADFVNKTNGNNNYIDGNKYESEITKLRETIASWYVALRNFALVGLLSVLVYVGIRIIISSAAAEKAKYKQMITAWLSAIALLFVLHYIMSFTFLITDKITEIFIGLNGNRAIPTQKVGTQNGGSNEFTIRSEDETDFNSFLDNGYSDIKGEIINGETITGVANLTQYARLYANITGTVGFRYLLVYIALVAFTVYFFFIYTKRVIYIAFLTLIAPLITLTYPIDKLNDGQAQGFNVWIKEFVFNVLLQPFHLLIYTIFIGMAIEFANSNLIYTIVAIGFILPAEKLLRKMFGFDKASTSGAFSGAAAGSMLATAISKAGSKAGSKVGSGNKDGRGGSSEDKPNITGTENDISAGYGERNNREELPEANNNTDNDNNENNTNNNNNVDNNNPDNDVPEWRDDLTEEEIADRDNLLSQRRASEAFEEEDREAGDYVSADEMARQAEARDRDLDQYRRQQEQQEAQQAQEQQEIQQAQEEQEQQEAQQAQQNAEQTEEGGSDNSKKQTSIKEGFKNMARTAGRKIGDKTGMRLIRGFGDMSSQERLKNIKKQLWNGTKTMAPKALKAGTKYGLAGAATILAGSAALISGDPKSVLSAAGLAYKGGQNIGSRISDKTASGITSASDTFMKGYYGKDYGSVKNEKQAYKLSHNNEFADKLAMNFGKDKVDEATKDAYDMMLKTGETDPEKIIAAFKTTKEYGGDKVKDEDAVDLKAAMNMPVLEKQFGDGLFNDEKKYKSARNQMKEALEAKGVDPSESKREAERALRDYAKYRGKQLAIPGQSDSTEGSSSGGSTNGRRANSNGQGGSRQGTNSNRQRSTPGLNSGNNNNPNSNS